MNNTTLSITKANARHLYKKANKEVQESMELLFGKENLVRSGNIMERCKTFQDCCEEVGEDHDAFMAAVKGLPKDEAAYRMLKIIRSALNEGHIPNWDDSSEYKYWPVFKMSKFGFSRSDCDYWRTNATAGSRLCFKSRELAEYAGTQFLAIYQDYITE